MGRIVLVTGGARSGKSAFAERFAAARGSRVLYVATAEALDEEMEDRIALHRARRPTGWSTREAPLDLIGVLGDVRDVDVVLVDCLSVFVSNRLLGLGDEGAESWREDVRRLDGELVEEMGRLAELARDATWDLVAVTNEVGLGIVPPTALGRAFRDLLGRVNAAIAERADAVYLAVAGLAVELKQTAVSPEEAAR